ncbi:adenosine receptor A1-like [Pocillopora verrucosa]|uniref:adenosine receptor A1-like n=1 Tax=Pocillopora verrucosa TaxID=203993 RepID=UPI00333EB3FC
MADSNIEGNTTRTFNDAINASQAKLVEIFAGLSIFLAIASSFGNVVILSALYRVSSIYPPTKLFFRCLAATDLCVGLIVQPLYTTSIMSYAMEMNENVSYYTGKICATSSTILCGVSLLTTTVISVDRLLALLLGLRYRTFVTLRRARFVITCIWIMMATIAMIGLWKADVFNKVTSVMTVLSLITSMSSYAKIYLTLRKHQTQIQKDSTHGQPYVVGFAVNIARYRKTVSSILWVQLALLACYAPYGIVAGMKINTLACYLVSSALVHLNSTLNPILYCWKIREVRKAVKDTIQQLHSC